MLQHRGTPQDMKFMFLETKRKESSASCALSLLSAGPVLLQLWLRAQGEDKAEGSLTCNQGL